MLGRPIEPKGYLVLWLIVLIDLKVEILSEIPPKLQEGGVGSPDKMYMYIFNPQMDLPTWILYIPIKGSRRHCTLKRGGHCTLIGVEIRTCGFQNNNLAITRRADGLRSSRFQHSALLHALSHGIGPMAQILHSDWFHESWAGSDQVWKLQRG